MPESPSRRQRAALNLVFHYAAIGLTVVQGFILVPLYLSHIPVALYGAWLATGDVLGWIELVDPGVSGVLQQRIAFSLGSGDPKSLGRVIGTGLCLSGVQFVLPLLAWPLARALPYLVHLPGASSDELQASFHLALLGTGMALAGFGAGAVNVGLQRVVATGAFHVLSALAGIGTTLLMLSRGAGLLAIPGGLLARSTLALLLNGLWLFRWCRKEIPGCVSVDLGEFRQVRGLFAFTFANRLGGALLTRMDAFLVALLISPSAATVLALTGKAVDVVRMLTERLGVAVLPGLAHLAGESGAGRARDVVLKVLRLVATIASVGITSVVLLNGAFVHLWVGASLFGGLRLTLLLGTATGILLLNSVLADSLFAMGQVRSTAVLGLLEAGVKLPLEYALIRALGISGVPLAAALGALVVSAVWLPRIAARLFDDRPGIATGRWLGLLAMMLGPPAVAALFQPLLARLWTPQTVAQFILTAGLVGTVLGSGALVANPTLRQWLRGGLGLVFRQRA